MPTLQLLDILRLDIAQAVGVRVMNVGLGDEVVLKGKTFNLIKTNVSVTTYLVTSNGELLIV